MTMDLRARFGFHKTPFTRELAHGEHFPLSQFDEALLALRHTVDQRMSAVLIAPAGTGKTALLRRLVADLPEARFHVRYVKVTSLSKRDMCREIAACCSLPSKGSYPGLVRVLQERFETDYATDGLRPVLVIDEAHEVRPDVLAMLRILTNFDMDSRLVLSIVLAGQPPLRELLRRDDQEAVARRMAHVATLRLLTRDELERYVAHRCAIAGATTVPFDAGALDALFELSRGNLRATDRLALKALEAAAFAGLDAVGSAHVVAGKRDLWV